MTYLGGQPVVELREPVLDGVDGDDAEDGPGHRVGQQQVDEGDDLHRLAWHHNQTVRLCCYAVLWASFIIYPIYQLGGVWKSEWIVLLSTCVIKSVIL